MSRSLTRYAGLLWLFGLGHSLLAAPATAQQLDFSQIKYTSTLSQIENADGWYDEKNYSATAAGAHATKHYTPDGIDLGNYLLYLTVGAGTTYDDNIYLAPKDTVGDFITEGTASIAFMSRLPRHLLDVYLDGRFVSFAENEENNYLDGSAQAEWRLDIDHGHALGGRFATTYKHEERGAPESPLEAREPVPLLANEAEVVLTRDQGRLGANFGLDFADRDYSDVEAFDGSSIDQDFRDKTSYGAYLRLNYRFSPGYKLLGSLRAGRETYRDDADGLRDATLYDAKIGLAFELSPLWRAYVTGGYGLVDYDDDNRGQFGAFLYDGQLQWLASPVLTMTLSAGQSIDEASFGSSGATLGTRAKLKVDYEAMRNLMLSASFGYERFDVEGDRTDDTYTGKIGAEYTINKNLLFTMGYEHRERFSSDLDFEMQDNRYTAGLKIRF